MAICERTVDGSPMTYWSVLWLTQLGCEPTSAERSRPRAGRSEPKIGSR